MILGNPNGYSGNLMKRTLNVRNTLKSRFNYNGLIHFMMVKYSRNVTIYFLVAFIYTGFSICV